MGVTTLSAWGVQQPPLSSAGISGIGSAPPAAEIYEQDGVSALSVRSIATRAGVSTGLLYRYFDDVSDLTRSLWSRPVAEFSHRIATIVRSHPNPLARLEAVLGAYSDWAHEHPDVYRGVMLLVRAPATDDPERHDVAGLPLHRSLRDAIAEGQDAGQVRAGDPDEMAQVLWAGVHGALALPVNIDRYAIIGSPELAPLMISTLMTAITAPTTG